jgi:mannose-6-phosphate isomerase-like protein (cupin superfamily)
MNPPSDNPSRVPPLPGAIGLTHLRVYDTRSPDGLVGGSPHVHLACTEAYVVIAGHGAVQTLGPQGFEQIALEPGSLVWFTPGIIHRLVNSDGQLEILVPMQNAGLPEAGDFVLTFPAAVLSDRAAYFEAAGLSPAGEVYTQTMATAQRRRDLAVQGFAELRAGFDRDGAAALDRFYEQAMRLIAPKVPAWKAVFERGPLAETRRTAGHLEALAAANTQHLMQARVCRMKPVEPRKLGVCGTLGVYLPEGVLT